MNLFPVLGISLLFKVDFSFAINLMRVVALWMG